MVLTVTEDTPADMLAGSMELLIQLPREHHTHTQRVTVERSTAMMDLLVQIATAHKLAASSYTLQAIGERGLVLSHQPNTPIGALDALQVKLLPKQGTFIPRHKMKQANQPFETTFRLQVHLPRNQLYVSRVSPKMNLGEILEEVCREKNLDRNKYELRHPGNHEERLNLSLSLEDYHLQEVTLYAKQGKNIGSALSSQDIMALQRQEERRRHQAKQSVFGFMFRKSKSSSLSTDSLGERSVSPARSDETGRSVSPLAPPTRPQRKRRQAPSPPIIQQQQQQIKIIQDSSSGSGEGEIKDDDKDKLVINHSRNSSDSSGYHEASVLSDHPDSAGARMPETLPRRSKPPGKFETRKLGQTSLVASKSMSNLAMTTGGLSHATSTTSISSTGIRKKRAAPLPPPINRPLSSAISSQALERIVDSEESLTSDMEISKPSSDIAVCPSSGPEEIINDNKLDTYCHSSNNSNSRIIDDDDGRKNNQFSFADAKKSSTHYADKNIIGNNNEDACRVNVDTACLSKKEEEEASSRPVPKPRSATGPPPKVPKRKTNSSTIVIESDIEKTNENENKSEIVEAILHDLEKTLNDSEKILDNFEQQNVKNNTEKMENKINSHEDNERCELNKNFTCEITKNNNEIDIVQLKSENSRNALFENNNTPTNKNNSSFIMHDDGDDDGSRNFELGMELTPFTLNHHPVAAAAAAVGDCDELASQEMMVKAANETRPTETDILLQKVSSTLAAVVPPPAKEIPISSSKKVEKSEKEKSVNSQQDTSDYVSVTGEDLSGIDWEYQLPDPPSAFRDNSSPPYCEPIIIEKNNDDLSIIKTSTPTTNSHLHRNEKIPSSNSGGVSSTKPVYTPSQNSRDSRDSTIMLKKKDMILELETKIENGYLNKEKNDETKRQSIDKKIQKLSPSDNTLSNFTITTYSRPQSMNIYYENDSSEQNKKSDEMKFVKTFATLSRNKSTTLLPPPKKYDNFINNETSSSSSAIIRTQSVKQTSQSTNVEFKKPVFQKNHSNIYRSKSYISLANNNTKYHDEENSIDAVDEGKLIGRATSYTNLNQEIQHSIKEEVSQSQNEASRELQSVQILKSILPQLKSQQTEEKISEKSQSQDNKIIDKRPVEEVVVEDDEPVKLREKVETKKEPESIKRYRYTGPPAISLGSWSERPSVNVQIKQDTDYKFGPKNTNNIQPSTTTTTKNTKSISSIGSKTIVNLNSSSNDVEIINYKDKNNLPKNNQYKNGNSGADSVKMIKNNNDENTTTKNFVNLHKTIDNNNEKINGDVDDDIKIDTRPVNFKELTQQFGQINLRKKPKYNSSQQNRHSDYFDNREKIIDDNNIIIKSNNKRYTSVVGINNNNNSATQLMGNYSSLTKLNGSTNVPVVKGFINKSERVKDDSPIIQGKKSTLSSAAIASPPPPPPPPMTTTTMPIITGVTLKNSNSKPKSMPAAYQQDPHDQLLESIRNFSRDKKLKCVKI